MTCSAADAVSAITTSAFNMVLCSWSVCCVRCCCTARTDTTGGGSLVPSDIFAGRQTVVFEGSAVENGGALTHSNGGADTQQNGLCCVWNGRLAHTYYVGGSLQSCLCCRASGQTHSETHSKNTGHKAPGFARRTQDTQPIILYNSKINILPWMVLIVICNDLGMLLCVCLPCVTVFFTAPRPAL